MGVWRLYLQLAVFSDIRKFSYKLLYVISDLKAFWVFMLIPLITFSIIFYVTDFWGNDPYEGKVYMFLGYFMMTYEAMLASWDIPAMEDKPTHIYSILLLFIGFTVLFTIILFNLLIAIVTNSYEDAIINEDSNDTKTVLSLNILNFEFNKIHLQMFQFFKRCFCKKRLYEYKGNFFLL